MGPAPEIYVVIPNGFPCKTPPRDEAHPIEILFARNACSVPKAKVCVSLLPLSDGTVTTLMSVEDDIASISTATVHVWRDHDHDFQDCYYYSEPLPGVLLSFDADGTLTGTKYIEPRRLETEKTTNNDVASGGEVDDDDDDDFITVDPRYKAVVSINPDETEISVGFLPV